MEYIALWSIESKWLGVGEVGEEAVS
jgi:hypothetical protein